MLYIYPQNLKAQAKIWLWNIRDLTIIGIALLISVIALSQLKLMLPLVITVVYGFLTIRIDDLSMLEFIKMSIRFFLTSQQYYEWRLDK